MFDSVFDRAGEPLLMIVQGALDECLRLNNKWVSTEHILLAMLGTPEYEERSIAAVALASMSIDAKKAENEIRNHLQLNPEIEPLYVSRPESADAVAKLAGGQYLHAEEPLFSEAVVEAMKRAEEYSVFFGQAEIGPEHLLLAITELKEAGAITVFEELSANLTFLRRQIVALMAREVFAESHSLGLRASVVKGLGELVNKYQHSVDSISRLAASSGHKRLHLPSRSEVVHMVVVTYLSEFLATQICFQRYLLEESIRSLALRMGQLDRELSASIVTSAAQNLRAEVRSTIEHMWCNEYRMLTTMLDDAEHDVIGSVIEDLWWAQSEEIALHESFAEAMDDHRRKHLLDVQKRRIEIAQRLTLLRTRLAETIQKSFLKHPISA